VSFARETREFLKGTPVALTYREYPIGHEISYQELRDLAAWTTEVLDRDETIPVDKTQEQEL
jgi:predicted esterase